MLKIANIMARKYLGSHSFWTHLLTAVEQVMQEKEDKKPAGKYPTKWTDLARKYRTLPSILDTGTNFSRKAAPHLASFIDVL
jgi:hypothetical protein